MKQRKTEGAASPNMVLINPDRHDNERPLRICSPEEAAACARSTEHRVNTWTHGNTYPQQKPRSYILRIFEGVSIVAKNIKQKRRQRLQIKIRIQSSQNNNNCMNSRVRIISGTKKEGIESYSQDLVMQKSRECTVLGSLSKLTQIFSSSPSYSPSWINHVPRSIGESARKRHNVFKFVRNPTNESPEWHTVSLSFFSRVKKTWSTFLPFRANITYGQIHIEIEECYFSEGWWNINAYITQTK